MRTHKHIWRLMRYRPGAYWADVFGFGSRLFMITLIGLVLRAFFNGLTGEEGVSLSIWSSAAFQLLLGILASCGLGIGVLAHSVYKYQDMALMIRNIFKQVLERPGAMPLPNDQTGNAISSGKAISTFRDDTDHVIDLLIFTIDSIAFGINAIIATWLMMQISPLVTIGTFLPLFIVIIGASLLGSWVEKYRKLSREATSQVTGLISDMFNGTQAIKVAHAEERIVAHFAEVNDQRREAMVKDRLITQLVELLGNSTGSIGAGLILLLAAQSMYDGVFTVGDFALFANYLWPVASFMRVIGMLITHTKQSGISFGRMETLMEGVDPNAVTKHHPIYMDGNYPAIVYPTKSTKDQLRTLRVENFAYRYPKNDDSEVEHGISDINLTLPKGSFTVITGRIGSGKTTLLKCLLGLLPAQSGAVYWNGDLVTDPGVWLTPPRSAYTGQVPRLFSESLRDNILMGLSEGVTDLPKAAHQAVLSRDIAEMEDGFDTLIGTRGVRLSGGQAQRTAAARMFIRTPELYIFDDLSSALDVDTERLLWERLFADREGRSDQVDSQALPTCLVVSHRRRVLRQADHILVLKDGKIEDEGTLDELLEQSKEMQGLWHGHEGG